MQRKVYAGIGWRFTPKPILEIMTHIAQNLCKGGYFLRSGGATGADQAFENGAADKCRIYRPQEAKMFPAWHEMAARFHPVWDGLPDYLKALHARNSPIILGDNLLEPVDFVVCYTDGGKLKGGTAQALKIALTYSIPIWNLAIPSHLAEWKATL